MSDFPNLLDRQGNRGVLSPIGPGTPFEGYAAITEISFEQVLQVHTANLAFYLPVRVARTCVALDMNIEVVTQNGNLDCGIYTWEGVRLVSNGGVACGAGGMQKVTIADTTLTPGWYFLGFASSSSTAVFRSTAVSAAGCRMLGLRQQATAFPLPNPAVFATYSSLFGTYITATLASAG